LCRSISCPLDEAGDGLPFVKGVPVNCLWCESIFEPRTTGGKPQRFCSTPCRRSFDTASRKWVSAAIEAGTFTVAEFRNTAAATRALVTGQIIPFPVAKTRKSKIVPSESNQAG
jgi:hypothetical protein